MTIDYTITYLIIQIPWGFYNSIITLVGGALGERNIPKAKRIFKITFYICIMIIFAFVSIAIVFSEKIVSFYSDNMKVERIASRGLAVYSLAVLPFEFI